MSKFSKLGLRRAAGACAIAAVAAIGLASTGAGEAAALALPSGSKVTTGANGAYAKIARTGEHAWPQGSLAANGAGRAAEVSGIWATKTSGLGGKFYLGYLIGCQVDISGLTLDLGAGLDFAAASGSLSAGLSIPLTPGSVASVIVTYKSLNDAGNAAIQLSRYQIDVQGCGGYAQARSVALVRAAAGYTVDEDNDTLTGTGSLIQSSLYGKPFSLN
ncbi:MAG: MspA family porin [Gordonia sp. (in: high G+C Gram-positive bacteria)]